MKVSASGRRETWMERRSVIGNEIRLGEREKKKATYNSPQSNNLTRPTFTSSRTARSFHRVFISRAQREIVTVSSSTSASPFSLFPLRCLPSREVREARARRRWSAVFHPCERTKNSCDLRERRRACPDSDAPPAADPGPVTEDDPGRCLELVLLEDGREREGSFVMSLKDTVVAIRLCAGSGGS